MRRARRCRTLGSWATLRRHLKISPRSFRRSGARTRTTPGWKVGRVFKTEAKHLSNLKIGVRTCGSHVPSAAAFAAPYAAGRIGSPFLPVVLQRALVTFYWPRHVTACLAEERPGEETAGEVAAAEAADAAHRAGSDGQGAMIAALAAAEERFNERQPGGAAAGELWGRDDHDADSDRTERNMLSQ